MIGQPQSRLVKQKSDRRQTRVQPSPTRVQPSPTRVQPSPTRVQPSPTRVQPSPTRVQPSPTRVQPSPTSQTTFSPSLVSISVDEQFKKLQKSHFFVSGKQIFFRSLLIVGAMRYTIYDLRGTGSVHAAIPSVALRPDRSAWKPTSHLGLLKIAQQLQCWVLDATNHWSPSGTKEMFYRSLRGFMNSVRLYRNLTDFLTHDFQRLTYINGL